MANTPADGRNQSPASTFRWIDQRQPDVLDTVFCVYCGRRLTPETETKEHVIGRRFVPRGTLANSWNVITKACLGCNSKKADLEDEVSALTLQASGDGTYVDSDPLLFAEAQRKGAGARSRKTGRPLLASRERITATGDLNSLGSMTLDLVAPPAVAPDRVAQLAAFHFQGFFSRLTYRPVDRRGYFPPKGSRIATLLWSVRSDWGNSTLLAFADEVRKWAPRLWLDAAEGYFRAIICRAPSDSPLWGWALQWNKNYRVIGLAGTPDSMRSFASRLPKLTMTQLNPTTRIRVEVPLGDREDKLFAEPAPKAE